MAKTSTERYRTFKKKLKKDNERYNMFKTKDKERKRAERKKPNTKNESEIAHQMKLNRDRVRKYRLLHKAKAGVSTKQKVEVEEAEVAYATPQALGKAVGKIKPHLPKSPRKRKAVIKKLASSTGIPLVKRKTISNGGNQKLAPEVIKKVQSFYQFNHVSRQTAGRKEFVVSWKGGKKEHLQKRYLLFSLKEAHALFLKDNPTVKIGLSKFSSLRPVNVVLSSSMPRNVCCCQYHENIKLLCDCLSKEVSEFPSYSSEFVDNFVCSSASEECMLGKCAKCPNYLNSFKDSSSAKDLPLITWYEWERVDVLVSGKKSTSKKKVVKKMMKVCKEGTINDALAKLEEKMPSFLQHVFIKRKQSVYFEETLNNLTEEECVIQVDFAENYSCSYQDEIQTAHWSQEQVTLFTVAVWTKAKANTERVCESHVIVSDDTDHDKKSVIAFLWYVINHLVKDRHPSVKHVYAFSDGPTSQFKNRYLVHFLHKLTNIVNIQWNFFATSHGKGVVDGIGATVKRLVYNAVTTRAAPVVQDAHSFYQVASALPMAVNVSLVSKKERDEILSSLCMEKCFLEAPPIHGISQFHCIEPTEKGFVNCRLYSSQLSSQNKGPPHVFSYDSDLESSCSNEDASDYDDCSEDEEESHDDQENDSEIEEIKSNNNEEEKALKKEIPVQNDNNKYNHHNIKLGIPEYLSNLLNQPPVEYPLPQYKINEVEAVLSNLIKFRGSVLIDPGDLKTLTNIHAINSQDKWLTNFVIDEYMNLIQSASHLRVKAMQWEIFEKSKTCLIAKDFQKSEFDTLDLIVIPCNKRNIEHWSLLVVLPKKSIAAVLDSNSKDFVKSSAQNVLDKMGTVLKELDCGVEEWSFSYNAKGEIPQQTNDYDCGVFICLYARCLAGLGPMVQESSFSNLRLGMVYNLHRKILYKIPESDVIVEQYYAVDYLTNYYIGRALSTENQMVRFKYLYRVGADRFDWSRRADINNKHISSVFYGPITLESTGPFGVPMQQDIEKIFKSIN